MRYTFSIPTPTDGAPGRIASSGAATRAPRQSRAAAGALLAVTAMGAVTLAGPVSPAGAVSPAPTSVVAAGGTVTQPNPGGGFGAGAPVHFTNFSRPHGKVVSRSAVGPRGVYVFTLTVKDRNNAPVSAGTVILVDKRTDRQIGGPQVPESDGRVTFRINPSRHHRLGKVPVQVQYFPGGHYRVHFSKHLWPFRVVK